MYREYTTYFLRFIFFSCIIVKNQVQIIQSHIMGFRNKKGEKSKLNHKGFVFRAP